MYWLVPRINDTTMISVETERMMPSSIRNERSLWARKVLSATNTGSRTENPLRTGMLMEGYDDTGKKVRCRRGAGTIGVRSGMCRSLLSWGRDFDLGIDVGFLEIGVFKRDGDTAAKHVEQVKLEFAAEGLGKPYTLFHPNV